MKGYVQVYTGNGKGKTTAALGLILRASGAGLRICLVQFMKHGLFSEIKALKSRLPEVVVRQFGTGCFVRGRPTARDKAVARRGLDFLRRALAGERYDLVIADEANTAAAAGLFPSSELVRLIDLKPESVEFILTGRRAPPRVVARAQLVTEMREIRHYFRKGVAARAGIEW